MQVHLFTNEGIYQSTFINFLEEHTNVDKRFYVFRRRILPHPEYKIKPTSTVVYYTNIWLLIYKLTPLLIRSNWFYIHYLPYGPSLFFLALIRKLLSKSTWIIWGGDLYIYRNRKLTTKTKLYELLRKMIIPKFTEIASFIEGDAVLAKKIYGSNAKYRHILYPLPIDLSILPKLTPPIREDSINVLVGNSADPTNFHIEALKVISKFSNEKIKVVCPLSYYSDEKYIKNVINSGISMFGDKFTAVTEFLTKEEYLQLLEETDICIMNHDRQQALGNIIPLLYMGKKIYMRKGITTTNYLTGIKCTVYDIKEIVNTTWLDFIHNEEITQEKNRNMIYSAASKEHCIDLWKNLLERT